MTKQITPALVAVFTMFCVGSIATAQEQDIQDALLRKLVEKGVLSATEAADLDGLAAETRAEVGAERSLQSHLDEMVAAPVLHGDNRVSYRSGEGLRFKDGDGTTLINISGYVQLRFNYYFPDGDVDDVPEFQIRRVRLGASGDIYEDWKYSINFDLGGDDPTGSDGMGNSFGANRNFSELKDAMIQWDTLGDGKLNVRVGQYRINYARAGLTSSNFLSFTERPGFHTSASGLFFRGRDVGAMAFGNLVDGGDEGIDVAYSFGIYNGEGENPTFRRSAPTVAEEGLSYVGRLDIGNLGNYVSFRQGDLRGADDNGKLLWGAAIGASFTEDAGGSELDRFGLLADGQVSVGGLFAAGGVHYNESEQTAGDDLENLGAYAQIGYFIIPSELEIAGRVTYVDQDNGALDEAWSYSGVVGYYFNKQKFRTQLEVNYVDECYSNNTDTQDLQVILQLHMRF